MDFNKPGPNKRVCAFLIDILIANICGVIVSYLLKRDIPWIIYSLYVIFKDCINGQSLGKYLVGIQVVDQEGSPANASMAIIRNVFMAIPFLPLIEYFVMVRDQVEGRRLGDRIAKTKVNDLRPQIADSVFLLISIVAVIFIAALTFSVERYLVSQGIKGQRISYDETIKSYPGTAKYSYDRGFANFKKGNYEKSIPDFDEAISLDWNYAEAYLRRGQAYAGQGDFEKAITDYDKAITIAPGYADAYFSRGLAYGNMSRYDQAIVDFNKCLEVKPDYADVYSARAAAYTYKGEFDQAIADCNRAIAIDSNHVDAYYNRADAYVRKGKFDMAVSSFNKAIEINPKYSNAYIGRAYAYYSLHQYYMAWDDVHKAKTLGEVATSDFLEALRRDSGREN